MQHPCSTERSKRVPQRPRFAALLVSNPSPGTNRFHLNLPETRIAVHRTCGSSTRENNTYFQNPGYPSPFRGMGTCHLLVYKVRNDICQVRLDFLEFQTAGPSLRADTAGQCLTDRFTVAGMHNMAQVPQVCGSNQGQHMYLDVDMEEAPIMVNMIIMGGDISRKWNIRIAQIPCGILTAPVGCLQWFTGLHGEVKSFNFDENSVHLADQHYTVCVRSESDFCSIEWRAVGSNEENSTVTGAFSISDGMPSGAFPVADRFLCEISGKPGVTEIGKAR
ncbi:unnamed protein product [Darwinula stevensoni]|uniref:CUB domain-containing protein n=1 Tax=Darwinula stevensoni TaxID=69355 RepID=A0A7R9A9J3_9CRUS|nr:unnamed protein product [Darwinula stevensoni]CAG0897487.1 unnamed protein product [Darwinula stevensoni]